ncbi:MAG TPA: RimK family protein [Gammaproteobacteria bacterium]|nr:RimK family protein [Gammaproteobacteria bacterium]
MNETTRSATGNPTHIIVVEYRSDWRPEFPQHPVVLAKDYLEQHERFGSKGIKVINLCRSYAYLSTGYYCSLLAEARRHKVIPSVRTMNELSKKSLYRIESDELESVVQRRLKRLVRDTYEINVFFGQCNDTMLDQVGHEIFEMFPCPLLRIEFERNGKWEISRIKTFPINQIVEAQREPFATALNLHASKRWRTQRARSSAQYDLAILYNPDDPLPPSDERALGRFIRAGKELDINVEIIDKHDYAKLTEYDALLIRETTSIENHTYRFARKAENEGMVVMDDPNSILNCTNKIYLAELLRSHRVPRPHTVIVSEDTLDSLPDKIPFPIVLKIPDGSFSRGVVKAGNPAELEQMAEKLFEESDLILAQEFVYTQYDWRVGILNRQPLYVCQYFMSKDHWQILKHEEGGRFREGAWRTLAVNDAPKEVVNAALKAANLIGDGLYGVDIKQNDKGIYVIEVNDNPNIESGVEDGVLKDDLYLTILREFQTRLGRKHRS